METKKAWTPSRVAFLSFFFSFIPAGILYAFNAERFKQVRSKHMIIIPVMLLAIALIAVAIFDILPGYLFKETIYAVNFIAAILFYASQKNKFEKFTKEGGKSASFLYPIIYSLVLIVLPFAIYLFIPTSIELPEDRLYERTYGNGEMSVEIPEGWDVYEPSILSEDLIVEVINENGIANLNIDNVPYFVGVPNAQAITQSTPTELLQGTFQYIEQVTSTDSAEINWSNFKTIKAPQEVAVSIEGVTMAAEGVFTVDENILDEGNIINRTIKRIILFTNDDILNIVFASTTTETFDEEYEDFKIFLDSLSLK